jgi:hypothetical protein
MLQAYVSSEPSKTVDLLRAFLTRHFVALHMILIFLVAAGGRSFNSAFIFSFSIFGVVDPDPDWIKGGPRIRIRIRIQEGKNDPQI